MCVCVCVCVCVCACACACARARAWAFIHLKCSIKVTCVPVHINVCLLVCLRTVRPTHPRKSSDVKEGRAVVSVMMSLSSI